MSGTTDRLDGLTGVRSWVIDVDGCLVQTAKAGGAGGTTMPGAVELIAELRARGDAFIVCTNASERPPCRYAEHLRGLGLDIADSEFVTAGSAAADHVAHHHPGARVLAVGADGLSAPLHDLGMELVEPGDAGLADVVVVGAAAGYSTPQLNAACLAVDSGAPLYTTVNVPWFHGGRGKAVAVSAAVAAAIGWTTGTEPVVVGKPSPYLGSALLRRLGGDPAETAVVGDATIEIELARSMGATSVLVLSGAVTPDQAPSSPRRRTWSAAMSPSCTSCCGPPHDHRSCDHRISLVPSVLDRRHLMITATP